MNMMLSEIAACVQGQLVGEDVAISSVSIDTRAIKPGQLYVAIKGHNFDGNEFVSEAEQAGAVAAIVHQGITATIPHIVVDDTRLALAELAGVWRKKSSSVCRSHRFHTDCDTSTIPGGRRDYRQQRQNHRQGNGGGNIECEC